MGQLPRADQVGPPPPSSMPARRRLTDNLPVLIGQVVLLGLGIGVIVESTALGLWTTLGPGPGLLPLLLGIALVGLTAVWVVQSITSSRTAPTDADSDATPAEPVDVAAFDEKASSAEQAASPASPAERAAGAEQSAAADAAPATADSADEGPERLDRFYVGVVLVSLLVLASVIDLLGFQISMALFLLLHLRWMGRRGWLLSIALSVISSVGIFVLFDQVLQVPLPLSSLPALSAWGL